ncbi:MAG: right-handed parallel beta-helix repeat-containing protein [Elusimicrobia bacterium]|nr:right-handed parallel beta-helix repeat-containing protein [Elusimicrobiota bacterium]
MCNNSGVLRRFRFFLGLSVLLLAVAGISKAWADCTGLGASYYIDATSGNDSNSGLSAGLAWKSIGKFNSFTFNPCDNIFLKRGETWKEEMVLPSSGTAGRPIAISAYGNGNNPVIDGSDIFTGWILETGAIYRKAGVAPSAGQAGIVIQDNAPLIYRSWNTDVATTFSTATAGSFAFDYNTNIMYVWATDDADPDTHTIHIATRNYCVQAASISYVNIENITLQRAAFHCARFASVDNIHINSVVLSQCGGRYLPGAGLSAGNGVEWQDATTNSSLTNSSVVEMFDTGASPQMNNSNFVMDNLTISNNVFDLNGMWGVEVSIPLAYSNSSIRNITIANNTVKRTGKGWSSRGGTGVGIFNATSGTQIENVMVNNNTIADNLKSGILVTGHSGPVTISRNDIHNNGEDGIFLYDNTAASNFDARVNYNLVYSNSKLAGGWAGLRYYAPFGRGYQIYNNTFYDNGDFTLSNPNVAILDNASTGTIKNNIFYGIAGLAFFASVSISTMASFDHNLYWSPSAFTIYYNGSLYSNSQFPAYQAAVGANEGHGLAADPLLINAAAGSFGLRHGSPAINAGIEVGLTSDFSGTPVSRGARPDIGALEFWQADTSSPLSMVKVLSLPLCLLTRILKKVGFGVRPLGSKSSRYGSCRFCPSPL